MSNLSWKERIKLAQETGAFTEEDRELVGEWEIDPVGEWASEHPDAANLIVGKGGGRPMYNDLRRFGYEFMDAVEKGDPDLAGELLGLIERTIEALTGGTK